MKNTYYYIGQNPTCDLIILNHNMELLLIKRSEKTDACPGMWALPGGFIDSLPQDDKIKKQSKVWISGLETPEEAAKRELKEETNLDIIDAIILPIGIYEGNQRDPRDNEISWSRSHAFFYEIDENTFEKNKHKIVGLDDADKAEWKSIKDILHLDMAFDHKQIIIDGLLKYKPDILTNLITHNITKLKR